MDTFSDLELCSICMIMYYVSNGLTRLDVEAVVGFHCSHRLIRSYHDQGCIQDDF